MSTLYRLVNKPWDMLPIVVRAHRFARLRRAADEASLVAFWQDMRTS